MPLERAPDRSPADADAAAPGGPVLRLLGFPPASAALLAEWLRGAGYEPSIEAEDEPGSSSTPARRAGPLGAALVLLHLAFPRREGLEAVRAVRRRWPGAAVLLASPTLHPGIFPQGTLAQLLGAQAVVALPVQRDMLLALVQGLLAAPSASKA